jgi:hypothetical protein
MIDIKGEQTSYKAHNREYEDSSSLEWHKTRYSEFKKNKDFEVLGFKKIIDANPLVRDIHIDLGSGAGWLLSNTAPIFKKVIGIEPSLAAINMAKYFNKDFFNIEYLNLGMIEGLEQTKITLPTFFTTSIVLTHIKNSTVMEFLKLINNSPTGSVLFFFEPYDKNCQQYLWHIRSKHWWAKNLSNWDLNFNNYKSDKYLYGISGICVGADKNKNNYQKSILENILWYLSGLPSRFKYLGRLIINLFKK